MMKFALCISPIERERHPSGGNRYLAQGHHGIWAWQGVCDFLSLPRFTTATPWTCEVCLENVAVSHYDQLSAEDVVYWMEFNETLRKKPLEVRLHLSNVWNQAVLRWPPQLIDLSQHKKPTTQPVTDMKVHL